MNVRAERLLGKLARLIGDDAAHDYVALLVHSGAIPHPDIELLDPIDCARLINALEARHAVAVLAPIVGAPARR